MFKLHLAVLALLLSAASASAAILEYNYQGEPFGCPVGADPSCFGGQYSGSLRIDERLLPGGSIADATLELVETGGVGNVTYSLTNSAGNFSGPVGAPGGPIFASSGVVSDILAGSILDASFEFTFDSSKEITDWAGACTCGGSNDIFTSSAFGDSNASGADTSAPGSWSLTTIPVSSEVLKYSYTGQPIACGVPGCPAFVEGEVFTGSITITEALLPNGGDLSNATLVLEELVSGDPEYAWTFTNAQGTSTGEITFGDTDFFKTSGIIDRILGGSIQDAVYSITWNAAKEIIDWSGTCTCGGSNDIFTSTTGDGYAFPADSAGPGSWTKATVVPLPAAVWLMLAGLMALGAPRALART